MLHERVDTSPTRARLFVLAALLVAAAVVFFFTLRAPAPVAVDVGTTADMPFVRGFFQPERNERATFRWSSPTARLLLHGASSAPHVLSLHMHGELLNDLGQARVNLQQQGETLAAFDIDPGWRTYRVLLPAGTAATASGQAQPIDVATPFYCPATMDNRVLGAPVDWIQFVPLDGHAVAAPLTWSLLLVWGLALLAALLSRLDARLWPGSGGLAAAARVAVPLIFVAAVLLAWARAAPALLVWCLTFAPWLLGAGTLLLLWQRWSERHPHAGTAARWHWRPGYGLLLLLLVLLLAHALLWLPLSLSWRGVAGWLLMLLPGTLAGWLLFRFERDMLLRLFLAGCGGLALIVPLLLLLHIVPGAPSWWALLLLCDGLTVLFLLLLRREQRASHGGEAAALRLPRPADLASPYALLALVLLLAAAFRFPWLGNAEFQGDEARAMVMAMGVQHGHEEILLFHRKGPAEVLLPAAPMVLTGQVNELLARLPCAWAGWLLVLGSFVLARRLFGGAGGTAIGLLAATLLALEGFLIAFSRIIQYQSMVACMGVAAMLCCWRFYEGTPHPLRTLMSAAFVGAVGILAHYDGGYVLPAMGFVVLAGGARHWRGWLAWARGLGAPLGVAVLLLGSFYVPFFLHENFRDTINYLGRRVDQYDPQQTTDLLFNNLISYYHQVTVYNTTFQIDWFAVVLVAGVVSWLLMYGRPRVLGGLLAALLLAGCALMQIEPDLFRLAPGLNGAVLVFGLPLLGLALFPATPAALRALVLWQAVPFIAMAFFIGQPRTHFYAMHVAAALLIALAVVRLVGWLRAQRVGWLQVPLAAGGCGLLLLTLPHQYMFYLQQSPEYFRSFPQYRPDIYQADYGDSIPGSGYFGYPHRDGWKVIGELYRRDAIRGTFNTNQRDRVGIWYTRGAFQCYDAPDHYFLARWEGTRLQTRMVETPHTEQYEERACVLVDNMRMLSVYTREPAQVSPGLYRLEDYAAAFDRQDIPYFSFQEALASRVPQYELAATWQGPHNTHLAGYDLDAFHLQRGEAATLALYWDIVQTPAIDYQLRVMLRDGQGRVVAEARSICLPLKIIWWSPYYLNTTGFTIEADDALPPGSYTLLVSLHHPQTGEPLALQDGTTSAAITTITVAVDEGEEE